MDFHTRHEDQLIVDLGLTKKVDHRNHIIIYGNFYYQFKFKSGHGRLGDSLGTVQEIKIWIYNQMVYAQIWISPWWLDALNSWILRNKQIN